MKDTSHRAEAIHTKLASHASIVAAWKLGCCTKHAATLSVVFSANPHSRHWENAAAHTGKLAASMLGLYPEFDVTHTHQAPCSCDGTPYRTARPKWCCHLLTMPLFATRTTWPGCSAQRSDPPQQYALDSRSSPGRNEATITHISKGRGFWLWHDPITPLLLWDF